MHSPKADDPPAADKIRNLVREHYDLGGWIDVEEIYGGYCNKSYRLVGDGGRRSYLLRRYNPNIAEEEIRFEHALLTHLNQKGFDLISKIIPCRSGTGYVRITTPATPQNRPRYWALFTYLDGDDAYSWTRTDLTSSEFDSAAEILARFHGAGCDFIKPPGADRSQPPIMAFLPEVKKAFAAYLHRAGDRRCDRLVRNRFDDISATIDGCMSAGTRFEGMPVLPIHCDYHPGNLKYAGGRGVGLFDFDWSKIDYRLFDVALGLVYFCSTWDDHAAPELLLEKMQRFLWIYDRTCAARRDVCPLSAQEHRGLEAMLAAANLYVLHWDLMDFYETPAPDDAENVAYIRHNVGLMDWIQGHGDDIKALSAQVGGACP
jgi:homoserine kinase type II